MRSGLIWAERRRPNPSAPPRLQHLADCRPAPSARLRRRARPPAVLAAGTSRYCLPSISYIAGEPTKLPPNRDDQSCLPVSLSHARIWLSRPAPNTSPASVTMMLLRICVTPVPVMPRSTSAGSSPKPMRHLMAGTFRSYLTMVVNGGFMPLPIVPYVLITWRSVWGTPSGYGGSAPRPRRPAPPVSSTPIPIRR